MTHRILSAVLASCVALTAAAEDLSTQITVDRTAATDLPAAQPLPSIAPELPSLLTPPVTLLPSYYSSTSSYTPQPDAVDAPILSGLPSPDTYRGYLWLGYLPVYDRALGAGYRLYDTSDSHAAASLIYSGANWGASADAPRKGLDIFGIEANGSHRFSDLARISLDIRYGFTRAGSWNKDEYFSDATSQRINDFKLRLGLNGNNDKFDWSVGATYSHISLGADRMAGTSIIEAPRDSRFRADLEGGVKLSGDSRFSLAIIADVLNSGCSFTVNPAYHLLWRNISARIGLKLSAGSHFDYSNLRIAPDVEVAWTPSGRFSAFIKADGGTRYFTLADQYAVSPFLTGALESVNTFSGIDSRIGFTFRPVAAASVSLFGAFESTDGLPVLTMPETINYRTLTRINANALSCGLSLGYQWRKAFDLHGEVRLLQHGYDHATASNPYHASVMAKIGAAMRPIDPLAVNVDWDLRAGQRLWFAPGHYKSIPNFSNLSLGGSYTLSERLSVFLRFNNILCRRTVIIPGVMSQRLGGLAGVNVRF